MKPRYDLFARQRRIAKSIKFAKAVYAVMNIYIFFFIIGIVFDFLSSILSRTFFPFAVIISISIQTIIFWKTRNIKANSLKLHVQFSMF